MHSAQTPHLPVSPDEEPAMMTWLDHLRELRNRVIKSSLAVIVGLLIGFFAVTYDNYALLEFIKLWQTPEGTILQAVAPAEVFTNAIRVALAIGIAFAMPVLVYQLLAFIVPGLTSRERQIIFL